MPNPGSPQAMQKNTPPPMPMSKNTMIGMFAVLIIMMVVMGYSTPIGRALNYGLWPLGFSGDWPVLTLIIAGVIMISISTIIRTYMTDFVTQARNQKISSEFQKEMRQARLENNLYKLKKLQEEQPKITANAMASSTQMMKLMPITMIVIMPIYAWVYFFLANVAVPDAMLTTPSTTFISVFLPFFTGPVNLLERIAGYLPIWIIIYTMISLPIGQLETRIVRYFLLKRRLRELDGLGPKKLKSI